MRQTFGCIVVVLMCAIAAAVARDPPNVNAYPADNGDKFLYANTRVDSSPSIGQILRPDEFQRFSKGMQLVRGERCKLDLNATLWGVVNDERWAVAIYDASAKGAFGVENGLVYQFGHYDQCVTVNDHVEMNMDHVSVRTKYCLAEVTLDGIVIQKIASRKYQPGNSTVVHWGACVPASCDAKDIEIFLENVLQKSVAIDEKKCQPENKFHMTKDMLIYASVFMFFVALAFASTSYHIYQICANGCDNKKPTQGTLDIALKSFSIIENLRKIFQGSNDQLGLNAINGIKALAMLLILAGHALLFIYSGPVYNTGFMAENIKQVQYSFLTNSLLFVDIFLLLSGFLFCRILLIELERRRGNVNVVALYVGRYVRLTPSYMAVIGFYMTWFTLLGSGPIWAYKIGLEQERCQESWWLNLLYVNNYIATDKLCMFQSWYLSVDSQLFILAPVAIYTLNKSRKCGLCILILTLITAVAIPFTLTVMNGLDPTLMVYPDEVQDFVTNPFYIGSYIKTHMRATSYVMGLLAGFIVHVMQERGTKLPKYIVWIFWLASVIIGVASMFCITLFYINPPTVWESAFYSAFHKFGWGLSIGWVAIAVTTGHAVGLQRFLSHRFFAPIGRLTYCAFLCNGIVELYHANDVRSPLYLTKLDLFNKTVMHVFDTFALALIVCLLFESPIHALERIIFRASKKHPQPKGNSATPSTSEEQVA